jgi:4-hydroxy-tetrahydrodipicolinate synthase
MLVVPEFVHSDSELETYLFTMAERVDARLGLYECPVPRSYHLGIELVEKLARSGRFFAYKETSCDPEKICILSKVCAGTELAYLQANTPYLLDSLGWGAPGTMSIAAAFAPDITVGVIELFRKDDPQMNRAHDVLCAMDLAERVVHPVGLKYLLSKRGLPISTASRAVRDPLSPEVMRSLDSCARVWF